MSVSVKRQQRAQVGDVHQADGNGFVDHHGGGGEGQAAVGRRKVPNTTHQWPSGAAHQHQCLQERSEVKQGHSRGQYR